jgi:predicted nucleic acid-binding Zn ribbon protein
MTFMNRGMQNKRQRIAVLIIVGIVILSFLVSIVALSLY